MLRWFNTRNRRADDHRADLLGYWNTDFSIQKDTLIIERTRIQLRLEAYNVFSHTNFANPSGDVNSSNFGRISALRRNTNQRQVQLGAKFFF